MSVSTRLPSSASKFLTLPAADERGAPADYLPQHPGVSHPQVARCPHVLSRCAVEGEPCVQLSDVWSSSALVAKAVTHISMLCSWCCSQLLLLLLQTAFKGIGTLKTDVLHQVRTAQEKALVAELAAHKKRLEDILCSSAARSVAGSNPLASALGQVKASRLPSSCAHTSKGGLKTIMEIPIEMY